jgi:hypothetical protein
MNGDHWVTVHHWWCRVILLVSQDFIDEEALALLTMAWHELVIAAEAEAFHVAVCNFRWRQTPSCGRFGCH